MYIARNTFGLFDEGSEDVIYNNQTIRGLAGIVLGREAAPDATTLLKSVAGSKNTSLPNVSLPQSTYIWP